MTAPTSRFAAFAILAAAALYLWPAALNGFPLVYWDTGGYLMAGVEDAYEPNRSIWYAWFLEHAGLPSAWGVAIVQALIAAAALGAAARGFADTRAALILALALGGASALSWYASWLMPDVFAGLALLAVVALAFGSLGGPVRAGLTLLLAFSVAVHTSHLPMAAGAVVAAVVAGCIFGARARWKAPAFALVLAIGMTVAGNAILTGQAFFNRTGFVLLFARFAEGGIAHSVLERHCTEDAAWTRFCPIRHIIPNNAEQWLWSKDTPFWEMGDWGGTGADSRKVVLTALVEEPGAVLAFSLDGFAKQLARIRLGEGTESQLWFLDWTVKKAFPAELGTWESARQQKGELAPLAARANWLHLAIIVPALALNLFVLFLRQAPPVLRAAAAAMLAGVIGNAFVCGALSGPHDRYHARLIWAALATAVPVALWLRGGPQSKSPGRG